MYAQKKIALDNYVERFNALQNAYYNADGSIKKELPDLTTTYKTAHEALASFNENQLIYDEFNFYQDTNQVLGIHPVFRVLKLTQKIKKMREASAVKRYNLLRNYIYRDTKKLKTISEDKKEKFANALELKKEEFGLIEKLHPIVNE
ncbi:hypothetical protein JJL45_05210 [Tamlana sp. s12]|uniref:hypothetical protein n=1 Tax=Tamlana sp. s12 TaxID=1630406 RepID=UPI0007FDDA41|nr:hypothetical protein [Tamlana sp. s12]OBQ56097.1 hypothetical protein VQ01_06850 [Tamlana sp. s12]QQY83390.1 hypothetical protein JJL45_05210 [Tamlana sp. s12]